jgi:hypothetical protein
LVGAPLHVVGLTSYGIYLWQQLFTVPKEYLSGAGSLIPLLFPLLCLIVPLSYFLLEKPAMRYAKTRSRRTRESSIREGVNIALRFRKRAMHITRPKTSHGGRFYFERADALAIISLFAIGALVYGVFIPSLGFYWDDWPMIWVYNALGPSGLAKYWAGERPMVGWIYASLAPSLGIRPIGWHIASLVARCASSATLFVAFCAFWPRRKDVAWLVGTLVLLYPGFTQQPIALTYLPHHLSFLLFTISLATTIFSVTTPVYRWIFLPISLVAGGLSYLIIEYFVGLELFRLFIIGVLTNRQCTTHDLKKKVQTALIVWSPYATVWAAYIVWRAFVYRVVSPYGTVSTKDVGSDISRFLISPLHEVLARVLGGIHNILMATVFAWARPFSPNIITPNSHAVPFSWVIATIVVAIAIYTLRRLTSNSQPAPEPEPSGNKPRRRFPETGLLLGVLGLGVAGLPFLVSGLSTEFATYPSFGDRFTLPFMLAASLTLLGLVAVLGATKLSRMLLVSLILFAFSANQVQNENLYRQDWLTQKSLFWQLAWRAPVLKQGTSIFADGLPRSLYGNHSAGILDLLYTRDDSAGRLDYFIFDLRRLSVEGLSWAGAKLSYRPGDTISGRVRSFQFWGATAQSLVVWISPSGTLRIVTQRCVSEILRGSALCFNLSQLSQPGEVISDAPGRPNGPLLKIFGSEPMHEWSYFYQRAELERQLNHWDAVTMLGDEVMKQGLKPSDPSEWFPFIDGYTRAHKYQTAEDITISVLEECPDALAPLSSLWLRVQREDLQKSTELSSALRVLKDKLILGD